jgi:hypothetical protein
MARPSRRAVLAFLTATGAVAAAGVYLWRSGPGTLVGEVLRRRFPGVRVNPIGIAVLTRDIEAARSLTFGRRLALESGARVASVVGLDAFAHWRLTSGLFSQFERKVVTYFVLGSDLLDVKDPKSDLVTYYAAPGVCANRFAEYDE